MSHAVHGGTVKLSPKSIQFLENAKINGCCLYLPEQIPRASYAEIARSLAKLGGKWDKTKNAIVFPADPTNDLNNLRLNQNITAQNDKAFYPTPSALALEMAIEVIGSARILEPSAGDGAIARIIREKIAESSTSTVLEVCEINPERRNILRGDGFEVIAEDFLSVTGKWNAIVMNPPFNVTGDKSAWATHLLHAWQCLEEHGVIVAIVPDAILRGSNKNEQKCRELLLEHGSYCRNPTNTFKHVGVKVSTLTIKLQKSPNPKRLPFDEFSSYYAWQMYTIITHDRQCSDILEQLLAKDDIEGFGKAIKEMIGFILSAANGQYLGQNLYPEIKKMFLDEPNPILLEPSGRTEVIAAIYGVKNHG
jgi:hypothetical protein